MCSGCITHPIQLTAQNSTGSRAKIMESTNISCPSSGQWNRRYNITQNLDTVNHQLQNFISVSTPKFPGHDLRRKNWVLFNRIRSGHGSYAYFMNKIGARDNPYCNCGDVQTPQHILSCNVIGITGDIINVD